MTQEDSTLGLSSTLAIRAVNPPELEAALAAVGNIVTVDHVYIQARTAEDGSVSCQAGARFLVGSPTRTGHVHIDIDHHGALDAAFADLLRENMAELVKRANRDGTVTYVAATTAGEDI